MYTSILVPLDGSALSERALPVALGLAQRSDARVKLFHAHESPPSPTGPLAFETPLDHDAAAEVRASLDALARRLTVASGLDVCVVVRGGLAAASLLEYADTSGADLIVMATHGSGGLGRIWLGSVASEVVHRASVPVLLIGPQTRVPSTGSQPGFRRIVVPLDGTEVAEAALDHAAILGTPGETLVMLVRVVVPEILAASPPDPVSVPIIIPDATTHDRAALEYLERARAPLRDAGFETTPDVLVAMEIASAIREFAESHEADLIALAARPRGTLSEIVLGSVAHALIHRAPVPVLVYHPRGTAAADLTGAPRTHAARVGA